MEKIIVITGASSGIGLKLKEFYEKDGCRVINFSRNNSQDYVVDVSSDEQVCEAMQDVYKKYGKIDVLINCAGYGVFGAVELTPKEKSEQIFDVNYFGTLWCCQEALKYMQKGAKIINISSACALFCLPYRSMYSASKSAVNMISYGLYMELLNSGIQVTSICPGDIKTNFSKNRDITLKTNERYGNKIEKSCSQIAERENGRMDPNKACKKIYKICNKKKLKPMYIIGAKYKIFNFLSRFISTKFLLKITNKFF